jgi:hypothetical protein
VRAASFRPHAELDAWALQRRPELRYAGGEEIREGDLVDFGLTTGEIPEEPWPGTVVGWRGVQVLVDTALNSIEAHDPDALHLLNRKEEVEPHPDEEVKTMPQSDTRAAMAMPLSSAQRNVLAALVEHGPLPTSRNGNCRTDVSGACAAALCRAGLARGFSKEHQWTVEITDEGRKALEGAR